MLMQCANSDVTKWRISDRLFPLAPFTSHAHNNILWTACIDLCYGMKMLFRWRYRKNRECMTLLWFFCTWVVWVSVSERVSFSASHDERYNIALSTDSRKRHEKYYRDAHTIYSLYSGGLQPHTHTLIYI